MLIFFRQLAAYKLLTCIYLMGLFVVALIYSRATIGVEFVLNMLYALAELGVVCAIGLLARCMHGKILRGMFFLIFIALSVIYIVQVYTIGITGGYLSTLALANAQTAYTTDISYVPVYIAIGIFFVIQWIEYFGASKFRPSKGLAFGVIAVGVASLTALTWGRGVPFANNMVVKVGESPVRSFINSWRILGKDEIRYQSDEVQAMWSSFEKPLRFKSDAKRLLPRENNIIVLFAEGFSARWSSFYGGVNDNLMPNFDGLAARSIAVDNYYNHTAATFRGLRGQLLSGYQQLGGFTGKSDGLGQSGVSSYKWSQDLTSLPRLLSKHGYESYFFLSQQNKLNDMLETLDFKTVYGRDLLMKHEKLATAAVGQVLSDAQLFEATLHTLERKSLGGERFFAGIYNFDTHTGLDGALKYADGENQVLNRFHTFDDRLGEFVRAFERSALFKNTTLIVTADHSTFPDTAAMKADDGVLPVFFDKIPMLVFYDGVIPKKVDADNQTTISFAPTLLHMLGHHGDEVTFFVCLLFDSCRRNRYGNIADEFYVMTPHGAETLRIDQLQSDDLRYVNMIRDNK